MLTIYLFLLPATTADRVDKGRSGGGGFEVRVRAVGRERRRRAAGLGGARADPGLAGLRRPFAVAFLRPALAFTQTKSQLEFLIILRIFIRYLGDYKGIQGY